MITPRNSHGCAELPTRGRVLRIEYFGRPAVGRVNSAGQEDSPVRQQHGIVLMRTSLVQVWKACPSGCGLGKVDPLGSLLRRTKISARDQHACFVVRWPQWQENRCALFATAAAVARNREK